MADLASDAHALLLEQRASWDLAVRGYASLETVEARIFPFGGYRVIIQYNPGRITSSSAKVDERSIRERKCFLCPAHLPEPQRGFLYRDDFLVLANPFPIFPEHFTIPHRDHLPQQILPALGTFLGLLDGLSPRYSVLYNGPRCGASAPDHLHLQAGTAGFMPFEEEVASLRPSLGVELASAGDLRAFTLRNYLRTFIALESPDLGAIERGFRALYAAYQRNHGDGEEEPMMNLIGFRAGGVVTLAMFARTKHRPSYFFLEGDAKMMLSPACVDVGGVITLPIEKDFRAMTPEIITRTFEEVHLPPDAFSALQEAAAKGIRSM
jgi:hypothetical protein